MIKKKYYLFLVLVFSFLPIFSQDTIQNTVQTRIKSYSLEASVNKANDTSLDLNTLQLKEKVSFYINGQIKSQTLYDEEGTLLSNEINTYNSNNHLIKKTIEADKKTSIVYEYTENYLVRKISFYEDDKLSSYFIYHYSNRYTEALVEVFNAESIVTQYKKILFNLSGFEVMNSSYTFDLKYEGETQYNYDSYGNITQVVVLDSEKKIIKKEVYIFDKLNRPISKQIYSEDASSVLYEEVLKYNDNGLLSEKIITNNADTTINTYFYRYKMLSGLWIEKTEYEILTLSGTDIFVPRSYEKRTLVLF